MTQVVKKQYKEARSLCQAEDKVDQDQVDQVDQVDKAARDRAAAQDRADAQVQAGIRAAV